MLSLSLTLRQLSEDQFMVLIGKSNAVTLDSIFKNQQNLPAISNKIVRLDDCAHLQDRFDEDTGRKSTSPSQSV